MIRMIALSIALLAVAACSTTPYRVDFDYDREASFSGIQTWAWIGEHPMIVSDGTDGANPLWEKRIMAHIADGLAARGYRRVDDADVADVTVSFTVGTRDKIQVTSYPVPYRAYYGIGWRHGYFGTGVVTETEVREYTEGMLAIDVFDVRSHSPIWHGYATGNVRRNRTQEEREALLQEVIGGILDTFPPS